MFCLKKDSIFRQCDIPFSGVRIGVVWDVCQKSIDELREVIKKLV